MPRTRKAVAPVLALVMVVLGCARKLPKEALQLTPESLRLRQLQTRRFESKDEKALLAAGAAVLQDLGFTLDESETGLGVIVASKDRSAVETAQVVGSIFLALVAGVSVPWDEKQKIRSSLITRPAGPDSNNTFVRVTFQRIVWNTQGQVSRTEPLDEPMFYQEFFERLSKAVFLHAHEL